MCRSVIETFWYNILSSLSNKAYKGKWNCGSPALLHRWKGEHGQETQGANLQRRTGGTNMTAKNITCWFWSAQAKKNYNLVKEGVQTRFTFAVQNWTILTVHWVSTKERNVKHKLLIASAYLHLEMRPAPNRQQKYLLTLTSCHFWQSVTSTSKHQEAKNARAPSKYAPTSPTNAATLFTNYNRYPINQERYRYRN